MLGFFYRKCGFTDCNCGLANLDCGFAARECGLAFRECGLAVRECGLAVRECGFAVRPMQNVRDNMGNWQRLRYSLILHKRARKLFFDTHHVVKVSPIHCMHPLKFPRFFLPTSYIPEFKYDNCTCQHNKIKLNILNEWNYFNRMQTH